MNKVTIIREEVPIKKIIVELTEEEFKMILCLTGHLTEGYNGGLRDISSSIFIRFSSYIAGTILTPYYDGDVPLSTSPKEDLFSKINIIEK